MADVFFRGGSRIGWVNATWPFAKLTIASNQLSLSSLGRYDFTPAQVISIEKFGSIPLISSGVRINHNRPDYPDRIVFWYLGSAATVLDKIHQIGFVPSGKATVRASGNPVKWTVVIVAVAVWNALLLLDGAARAPIHRHPGILSFVAIFLLFCSSTLVQVSPAIQRLILREGHRIGEIKSILVLLQIVAGIMSLVFGTFLVVQLH